MDAIKLYLKDIRSLPLLTAEQEKDLARKIKKGNKKARQQMIKSNLRLVINIAKKYSYLGVPMLDLIEEGNLGLMKAVNKYDPEKGYRFSTYAAWWIKQYITRAVANQGKTVRIPVYVMEMLMRFQKVKKQLSQLHKKVPQLIDISRKMKLPLSRVKQLNRMASNIASLNAPIGESGGSEFMDLIEDESIVNAVDELSKFLLQERIEGLLENMTPREKKILTLRFGLEDGTPHTLRDTAKHFGITRERVRQIEAACMVKLRKMMEDQEKDAEDRLFKKKPVSKATARVKRKVKVIKRVAGKAKEVEIDDRRRSGERRTPLRKVVDRVILHEDRRHEVPTYVINGKARKKITKKEKQLSDPKKIKKLAKKKGENKKDKKKDTKKGAKKKDLKVPKEKTAKKKAAAKMKAAKKK